MCCCFFSYEIEFKPSGPTAVDEDEGFSDWTQKLEQRTRSRMAENGSGVQLQQDEKNMNERSRQSDKSSFTTSIQYQQIQDGEDEEKRPERTRSAERRMEISERVSSPRLEEWHDDSKRRQQEIKPQMENKVPRDLVQYSIRSTEHIIMYITMSKSMPSLTDERGEEGGEGVIHVESLPTARQNV